MTGTRSWYRSKTQKDLAESWHTYFYKDWTHESTSWLVAMYSCESWTLKKHDKRRISSFEMKCLRQVLRVSRTANRTIEWVLETAGVTRSLLASVKERKLAYYGHMLRKKEVCLEKEIIQGSTPGTRGRPKTTWLNNITSWTVLSLIEQVMDVEDRHQWWEIIQDAANPRNQESRFILWIFAADQW